MAAETGSGKTGAFCLPVLQITWESLKDLYVKKKGGSGATGSGSSSSENSDGWRMSVVDRGPAIAISPDGLKVQSRHQKEWHGSRATYGVSRRGMYYFEGINIIFFWSSFKIKDICCIFYNFISFSSFSHRRRTLSCWFFNRVSILGSRNLPIWVWFWWNWQKIKQ